MNLHSYDNIERHYRHTDLTITEGLAIVAQILHLAEPPSYENVFFDLSLFSGGIGVLDRLAIKLSASPRMWEDVRIVSQTKTPEEIDEDEGWAEEFRWLLRGDEEWTSPRLAAVEFINGERREFQMQCYSTSRIFFGESSNANDWEALWRDDNHLNYLGFSQG